MATRPGFSMVELVVALSLLALAVLGMQLATGEFLKTAATSDRRVLAAQIAEDRIELIRADPNYDALSARYTESATPVPEAPGLTRETRITVVRDSTPTGIIDYQRITVTVRGAGLPAPVSRTIVLGRP